MHTTLVIVYNNPDVVRNCILNTVMQSILGVYVWNSIDKYRVRLSNHPFARWVLSFRLYLGSPPVRSNINPELSVSGNPKILKILFYWNSIPAIIIFYKRNKYTNERVAYVQRPKYFIKGTDLYIHAVIFSFFSIVSIQPFS